MMYLSRDENVPHIIIDRLYSFTILNRVICQGVIGWLLMLRTKSSITLIAFGLPPFQEMVNHARKKNLTLASSEQSNTKFHDDNMWLLLFILFE